MLVYKSGGAQQFNFFSIGEEKNHIIAQGRFTLEGAHGF
jgi:hypothetical protein